MQEEYSYGCVPFRRSKRGEMEALMILRTKGFWEFPKGKIEPGETPEACAARELKEETGLSGTFSDEKPLSVRYSFERDGASVEKYVQLYFCRVPDGAGVKLQKAEAADHAWLPLDMLADRATYPEMKEVARQVHLVLGD